MRTAPSLNSLSYFFLFSAMVAPHSWSLYEHGGTSQQLHITQAGQTTVLNFAFC